MGCGWILILHKAVGLCTDLQKSADIPVETAQLQHCGPAPSQIHQHLAPAEKSGHMMDGAMMLLSLVAFASSAPAHPSSLLESFQKSASLSRKILQEVQALICQYKEVRIGLQSFDDHTLFLNSLPSSRMTYMHWVEMQDEERLRLDYKDLQAFWIHVDTKHLHELSQPSVSLLSHSIEAVSLDLRDLISQLKRQILALNSTELDPSNIHHSLRVPSSDSDWLSNLQGYIIFRDLEIYLNKIIRDFTLLQNKYR